MSLDTVTDIATSGIGFTLPILVAASGELVSERAGVLNLSLEAMMLTGAFAGVLGAVATGSPVLGAATAVLAALTFGALQAVWSIGLRADQIVVGIASNALALGATTYGARLLLADGKGHSVVGFEALRIPVLHNIPVIGPALFGQTVLGYLCIALVAGSAFVFSRRTKMGLVVDAIGEDAVAADRTGLPVRAVRYGCVLLAAFAAGLGGAQLALSEVHSFSDNMTGGIGYLAVVAVIAGRWRALGVIWASVFFGIAQALQFALPALGVDVPFALLVMLPYLIAIVAVSGLVGNSRAPRDLTVAFARTS
ncbi:ABC transporter permease [Nocardia ignorata]|uniref:Nucleoside ABC transporter membrane protein n=1 Tax=Nocardia ignorata TaxID=145285 RepID=A0A4R6PHX9_NOCIG|nr:ABC transporter permease [Nocardia ignorata]TDP37934.1 nucleoside ABC transporter membrane protein [Nocardia ignorata]